MQSSRLSISTSELVDQSLNSMIEMNLIVINEDEQLEITKLGRATLKAMVDMDQSKQLYKDLNIAQGCLLLMTKLHLMYLVTPYDMVGTVSPIASTYFQVLGRFII